jgi:hypothetical protein
MSLKSFRSSKEALYDERWREGVDEKTHFAVFNRMFITFYKFKGNFTKISKSMNCYYKLVPKSPESFSQFFESIEKSFLVFVQKKSNDNSLLSQISTFSMYYSPDFLGICHFLGKMIRKK